MRLSRNEMNSRGGCQCKLGGLELESLVASNLAAGTRFVCEDCSTFDHEGGQLLATTDITPVVGVDLVVAGRIAALHAMSDIFASGGVPRWALVNLILPDTDPLDYGRALMRGLHQQCAEESVAVLGGQTIIGCETLLGLSVIGKPPSGRILRKHGAIAGDALLISKPIGVGFILRAYKLALTGEETLANAITSMTTSNREASRIAVSVGVHSCTDVSGFGLLGHLVEMLDESLGATICMTDVPKIPGVSTLPSHVSRTVWVENNRDYVTAKRRLVFNPENTLEDVLFDPQTNGGLLVAAPTEAVETLELAGFRRIGSVTAENTIEITVG